MVSVQVRIAGRLRHGGVGGCASLFEREGRDVRRLLRRVRRSISPRSPGRLIWREFPPTSRRPIITMVGLIRAARSSNGSTNRGRRDWRKTP